MAAGLLLGNFPKRNPKESQLFASAILWDNTSPYIRPVAVTVRRPRVFCFFWGIFRWGRDKTNWFGE
jgi:hypothetical protein